MSLIKMLFKGYITNVTSYKLYYLWILIICGVLFVEGQLLEGDSCTKDDKNGTCRPITSCPSAVKNLSELGHRPPICGFKDSVPIICCFDGPGILNGTQNKVSTTAETVGLKARQKCIEYSELIFEKDPSTGITIDNCNHRPTALFAGAYRTAGEFPHMALLIFINDQNEEELECTGTLISEEFVLTVAHCTHSKWKGSVKKVRLGELRLDLAPKSETQDFGVKEILVHPDFKPPAAYNDIALLRLDRKATINKFVLPACLHVGYEIEKTRLIVTGWLAPFAEETSPELMKRFVDIFPHDECNQLYNNVSANRLKVGIQDDTMICEGSRIDEKYECYGYSGSPVQAYLAEPACMYDIIGITSFGRTCTAHGIPDVATRVSAYIGWIESIVWPD